MAELSVVGRAVVGADVVEVAGDAERLCELLPTVAACLPPRDDRQTVDPKSRCFEIRIHTVDKNRVNTGNFNGGINELHQRFREKEVALFRNHGAEIIGVWQHLGDPNTLVWMLAYRDCAHREDVWAKFDADPEWTELRNKYMVPVSPNAFMLSATDYSSMK